MNKGITIPENLNWRRSLDAQVKIEMHKEDAESERIKREINKVSSKILAKRKVIEKHWLDIENLIEDRVELKKQLFRK